MDFLDKHTIKRIEGILSTETQTKLNEGLDETISQLSNEGFDEEDIFDYIRQKTINKLEE